MSTNRDCPDHTAQDAHAYLDLRCSHMELRPFSHSVHHMIAAEKIKNSLHDRVVFFNFKCTLILMF